MEKVIEILEEIRISQGDHDLVLEKGDQIKIERKGKMEEAKYPQEWSDHEDLAYELSDAINGHGGPLKSRYFPDRGSYGDSGSLEIRYNGQIFALNLYMLR